MGSEWAVGGLRRVGEGRSLQSWIPPVGEGSFGPPVGEGRHLHSLLSGRDEVCIPLLSGRDAASISSCWGAMGGSEQSDCGCDIARSIWLTLKVGFRRPLCCAAEPMLRYCELCKTNGVYVTGGHVHQPWMRVVLSVFLHMLCIEWLWSYVWMCSISSDSCPHSLHANLGFCLRFGFPRIY